MPTVYFLVLSKLLLANVTIALEFFSIRAKVFPSTALLIPCKALFLPSTKRFSLKPQFYISLFPQSNESGLFPE